MPISFAVARIDGAPVVDRAWLERQVTWANTILGPHGVELRLAETRPLDARHARLVTRRDRNALARKLKRGVVNCFVVASMMDIHEPGRTLMGVHWRPPTAPGKHLVILTTLAGETVLAHELGHFFGNPRHSKTPGNIMSYERGDGPPFLDARRARRVRASVRKFLRTGELRTTIRSAADNRGTAQPAQ